MVCSIVSFFVGGLILAIVGLVLSIQGQKKTPPGVPNNYAKAGKICGIIVIVLNVLGICALIAYFAFFAAALSNTSSSFYSYLPHLFLG